MPIYIIGRHSCIIYGFVTFIIFKMRLLLAILLPWLQFFTIGRPFAGIICLILQITVIGWIPAAIWSTYALSQYKVDRKIQAALNNRAS